MEGQRSAAWDGAGAGLNFLGLSPGGGARSLGFGWKVGAGLGTGKQEKKARLRLRLEGELRELPGARNGSGIRNPGMWPAPEVRGGARRAGSKSTESLLRTPPTHTGAPMSWAAILHRVCEGRGKPVASCPKASALPSPPETPLGSRSVPAGSLLHGLVYLSPPSLLRTPVVLPLLGFLLHATQLVGHCASS